MNPDQFFERDANDAKGKDIQTEVGDPPTGGGATDIFGTVASPPVTEWSTVPEIPLPPAPVPTPAPAQEPAMARTPLPVVHEVVFKASSSTSEGANPLHQLLRSAPPAPRPVETAPTPPASAGFTQLLRALNYDQTKAAEASPVVPPAQPAQAPVEAGSITQLLRTIDHPVMARDAFEYPASVPLAVAPTDPKMSSTPQPPSSSSAQVTSFRQEARQQVPVVKPSSSSPVDDASSVAPVSFTQIFESLDAKQVSGAKIEEAPKATGQAGFTQMFEALGTPKTVTAPAPVAPPVAKSSVPTAAPGSFTQMFQTLDAPTVEAVRVEASETKTPQVEATARLESPSSIEQAEVAKVDSPPSTAPGSFTQLFQSPAISSGGTERVAPVISTPEPAAASPGSFTQMFRSLDVQAPLKVSASESAADLDAQRFQPAPSNIEPNRAEVTPPVAASSGSFTQMFRSLDSHPAEPVSREAPSISSGTPGTFTQMFGTLSSPSAEPPREDAPPARSEAGSFTQLFGTLSDSQSTPQPVTPPSSFSSSGMGDRRAPEPVFGAGGVSQVFSTQQNAPEVAQSSSFQPLSKPAPPVPVGGGLTQLLRTLDQSPPSTVSYDAPPESIRPTPQQPGTFTSAYGSLNTENAPVSPAVAPLQSPPALLHTAPPVSAGPSEFTRILNASAFRENVLRGGESAGAQATPQAAQPAPVAGFQPMAMPSVSAPSVSASGGGVTLPKMPEIKAPEIPKPAAPAAGKMQQMLPLLLILIIFVLVAILVAVIILMKH